MATPTTPQPVVFFTAVLAANETCLNTARALIEQTWGEIEVASKIYPFNYTDYYVDEMGAQILRAFFAFRTPFMRDDLPTRKLQSNAMEKALTEKLNCGLPRPVNIDPGYLALEKLVLASCKDFSHRLYLGQGVFGEITLFYRKGVFEKLPWSFPDYASGDYDEFFLTLRKKIQKHG